MSEHLYHTRTGSSADAPATSPRRAVAVFDNYADAECAVDRLSDLRFPVERVAIIGHDLKYVEQVTGRANYGTAALKGAAFGALPGALIGWIFGLFNLVNPLVASVLLVLYGLIVGAIVGAVLGLIMHALQRGRRDFDAITVLVPSRYEVVADAKVADEAARLFAGSDDTRPSGRPDDLNGRLGRVRTLVDGSTPWRRQSVSTSARPIRRSPRGKAARPT